MRDTLQTFVGEAGFKVTLGSFLVAANAWYGKNAGGLYGHIFQMQAPGQPDVSGFGAWGQLGFSFADDLSLWAFGGIDKPNEQEARAAAFFFLQNVQWAGMLSYAHGPVVIALEYLRITTVTSSPLATAPRMPAAASQASSLTSSANQLALSLNYFF
jgi:hypothetical protein